MAERQKHVAQDRECTMSRDIFFPHSAVLMRKVPDVRLMTETSFDDGARNRNIQTWRLLSSSEVRVPLLNHAVEKRFWECFPITVKNFFV